MCVCAKGYGKVQGDGVWENGEKIPVFLLCTNLCFIRNLLGNILSEIIEYVSNMLSKYPPKIPNN